MINNYKLIIKGINNLKKFNNIPYKSSTIYKNNQISFIE